VERIYRNHIPVDNLHLRLFLTARVIITPSWWGSYGRMPDTFWRFYKNGQEGAYLEVAGSSYELLKNHLYLIPSGVHFYAHCTQNIDHFYIHFDVIGLPNIMLRELFDKPICLSHTQSLMQKTDELVHKLEAVYPSSIHNSNTPLPLDFVMQCSIKALLYEGLAQYLEQMPFEQKTYYWRRNEALEPIFPAVKYI
jgi:hypothetical protein